MNVWRKFAVSFLFSGVFLTALFIGCTRQIAVIPTNPILSSGPTNTPTNTPLATSTFTPTSTPTVTFTTTPQSPTNTFTGTYTMTTTPTPTATPTVTITPTPTPNYKLLDDFESVGGAGQDNDVNIYSVTDENGVLRNGYWYNYADGAPTTALSAGNPGNALECSGTETYDAGFGFTFLNAGTAYDATVAGTGNYTGISFDAKVNSMPSTNCTGTQVVLVDFITAGPVDHLLAIPLTITTSWQSFTLYYNQALTKTGAALDPTQLEKVEFQPQGSSAANYAFDISLDNIKLTNTTAPAPASPLPPTVIDDMSNGSAQIEWGSNPGYWYTYDDGSAMCPSGATNTKFFLTAPGHAGAGTSTFCARIWSAASPAYAGMGFWLNGANTDNSDISAYNQLVFWMKSTVSVTFYIADATTDGCYSPNSISIGSQGWGPVTATYNPASGSYAFGTNSTGGGCTNTTFTNHQIDPTTIGKFQWAVGGAAFDLSVDDIYLQ